MTMQNMELSGPRWMIAVVVAMLVASWLPCSCAAPQPSRYAEAERSIAAVTASQVDPGIQWYKDKSAEFDRATDDYKASVDRFKSSGSRSDLMEMLGKTSRIESLSSEVYHRYQLEDVRYRRDYGSITHEKCSKIACITVLLTAKAFASTKTKQDKDVAKKLYRGLITTYTGTNYAGYIREAEFGLEDLK